MVADSPQTLLRTYPSAVLLAGLLLDAAAGWSWADVAAGFVIAAIVVREGGQVWHGQGCCAPGLNQLETTNHNGIGDVCCSMDAAARTGPGDVAGFGRLRRSAGYACSCPRRTTSTRTWSGRPRCKLTDSPITEHLHRTNCRRTRPSKGTMRKPDG